MRKITYSIENRIVWKNVYDTKLHVILNFTGIYKGSSRKDCYEWMKKNEMREVKTDVQGKKLREIN